VKSNKKKNGRQKKKDRPGMAGDEHGLKQPTLQQEKKRPYAATRGAARGGGGGVGGGTKENARRTSVRKDEESGK